MTVFVGVLHGSGHIYCSKERLESNTQVCMKEYEAVTLTSTHSKCFRRFAAVLHCCPQEVLVNAADISYRSNISRKFQDYSASVKMACERQMYSKGHLYLHGAIPLSSLRQPFFSSDTHGQSSQTTQRLQRGADNNHIHKKLDKAPKRLNCKEGQMKRSDSICTGQST